LYVVAISKKKTPLALGVQQRMELGIFLKLQFNGYKKVKAIVIRSQVGSLQKTSIDPIQGKPPKSSQT